MEVLISVCLKLPKSSRGLEFWGQSTEARRADGSASPPRKIARRDRDTDVTRSKHNGPFILKVETSDAAVPTRSTKDEDIQLVRTAVREALDVDQTSVQSSFTATKATYDMVHSACQSLVTVEDEGATVYDNIFHREVQNALRRVSEKLREGDAIERFVKYCKWFESRIALLQGLLTYLDQVYIVHSDTRASIHDHAYNLFNETIFGNPNIIERLKASIAAWLSEERGTRAPSDQRGDIINLIHYFTVHGQFSSFEQLYIDTTNEFYRIESQKELEALPYQKNVQARITEEDERAKAVLPVGSWGLIRETTETALLDGKGEWLAKSLVPLLMDAKDDVTLGELNNLLASVNTLKPLQDAFRNYLKGKVKDIVSDEARDDEMVARLIELKAQADTTLSRSFTSLPESTSIPKRNGDFESALKTAFEIGFRSRRSKPAEMIAKYLHALLRKGQGALSNAEYEAKLDAGLALYRFSDDKDVFKTFYLRFLAKRLLLNNSASDDSESAMLKKLTEQYDHNFAQGGDMFKDLGVSRTTMEAYHSANQDDRAAQKLYVAVLQTGAWPFSVPKQDAILPAKMQKNIEKFTEFYKTQHKGRKLSFDHALGNAVLKAQFKAGSKDLTVSLYQTLVLLLFNEQDEFDFQTIKARLQMEDGELRRTLQSLACGKKKVLKKDPPGRDVEDGDVFHFNADFWDARARVHINSIHAKVSSEETQKTNDLIEEDRKHYLDAAIVRIMKGKKELSYEQLKVATIDAVKDHFSPQVEMIKQRIDNLVELEYLKRSERSKNVFEYVA